MDTLRFWLEHGVDGFRVDVQWLMIKDEQFRDEPPNPDWDGVNPHNSLLHIYTADRPEVHQLIREMRAVLDEYDDRMMVGEIYLPNDRLATYFGADFDEVHLPFNFQLIDMPWKAHAVRHVVDAYEASLPAGAWPNWVLSNHDRRRVATRVGPAQARIANMHLLTLRGTPTTYYGEEMGMENVPIPPEMIQDPPAVNQPELADIVGRDPVRTPMQWDASPNAGFTDPNVTPWLPLAADYRVRNVAIQSANPVSMLSLYRTLTELRHAETALQRGEYRSLDAGDDDIFAYVRSAPGDDSFLVVLNFGANAHMLDLSTVTRDATVVVSTALDREGAVDLAALELRPNEGLTLRL